MPMLIGELREMNESLREQPGRTAAGLNAALNGVAAHAMVKRGVVSGRDSGCSCWRIPGNPPITGRRDPRPGR